MCAFQAMFAAHWCVSFDVMDGMMLMSGYDHALGSERPGKGRRQCKSKDQK